MDLLFADFFLSVRGVDVRLFLRPAKCVSEEANSPFSVIAHSSPGELTD